MNKSNSFMPSSLPLNQIAFSVIDLRLTERWWREGLGFLPAGGNRMIFRGPLSERIVDLPGAAMNCWCMVGRNDWCQLEMFQYERPMARLMPPDFAPNAIGYTRCGVWVADFDRALAQLSALGTEPLTPAVGDVGQRRVCVRNPDGVFVELMEDDPLPEENRRGRRGCPVAIRSVTMSTPDFDYSCDFVTTALGLQAQAITLHGDEHEALWGLAGADCKRRVFGGPTLLLEVVEYVTPAGQPRQPNWRINDQGILNICFGDAAGRDGVDRMYQQSTASGARPNSMPQHNPLAGAFYTNDDLGFSYEFMWARPGFAHRLFGFVPQDQKQYPAPDNQRVEYAITLPGPPEEVFAVLEDHAGMTEWAGLGRVGLTAKGFASNTGRGAEREIATPLGACIKQIIDREAPKLLRYRIIKGSPFINYIGEVRVQPEGGGSRVAWSLRFRSRIPGLGALLRYAMQRKINALLHGLVNHLSSSTR
jgi:catechol 2,3-dioxygenase-like lactoylglutathione lyase family enzyme/uncharacterized protein YndB with AHSA1/START domain